jgi:WD40 repeat protein
MIRVMDLATGKIVAELPGYISKSLVQFSDDSKLLVMGDPYSARIWDVATWEQLDTHGGPTAGCGQYSTPQNRLLAMISSAGIMFTSEFDQKMQEMCGTKPKGAALMYYFYGPHQMVFVLGDQAGSLWIWDFGGSELARIGSDTPYPLPGDIFLAGDQASGWYAFVANGTIIVRNIDGSPGVTINEQNDYHYRMALQPEKKLMALGSTYGSIHIWTMP